MSNWFVDEWKSFPVPVVPVTDPRVNMFISRGIHMDAVLGYAMPFGSLKLPAAESLIDAAFASGVLQPGDEIVEASSGRMGNALVHRARPRKISVTLVMKPDVPRAKWSWPCIAGARIVTPDLGLSPIATARKMGGGGWVSGGWRKNGKVVNLDQYAAPALATYYRDNVAPKIFERIAEFDVIVIPVGTGGTIVGLSRYIRNRVGDSVIVVGAMCIDSHGRQRKNEIPGMRERADMVEIFQPWEEACDYILEVERDAAFLCAPWLDWSHNITAGPSGGAAYVAMCRFANRILSDPAIEARARKAGIGVVRMLFIVHDDVVPYAGDRFTTEYALENFHPSTAHTPAKLIFG